ncbi:MAG TPA: Calx-beta domain-containing protein, partial [Pyrinomonadaceae bacterium]|nr:Calx-beta domain-containing protein [Pyrinomonadaceae bacterium]
TSEGGVFKTTDGGANWSKTSNGLTTTFVHRVVVSPQTPSTVYATSIFGVHKSVDGGAGWATSLANGFAGDIVVDPQNNSNAYVIATVGASLGTIYKTTDGGATWRKSGAGLLGQLAALGIDPLTPSNLYTASNVFGLVDADAFVLKLNAAGTALEYSTPLGGTAGGGSDGGAHDYGTGIAVDSSGAAYVSGWTLSIDFPVSSQEVYQVANRGNYEGFIAKLSPSLRIAGRVADAQGNAQAGVKVTLSGSLVSFTTTGADGLYEFDGLAAGGSYTVSATKAGFAFAPPSQTFDNLSASQSLDFTASASGAAFFQISGRVTEAGTGLALPGARVALAGSQIEFATTDGEGRYSFTAPGGGSYTLTASSLGFAFAGGPVSIANLSADRTADFAGARQTLVVTSTNDHGAGSLRQAILDANSMAGADRITFNIPGSGVRTISPVSPLPEITGTVELDATTQPGFAGTPVVELSGAQAGGGGAAGLTVAASNCLVRGFVINRFNGANGIRIAAGEGSRVEGNYIGTDAAGEAARPNHTGVAIGIASNNNRIGGPAPSQRNVISGNTFGGVTIASAGNRVQGNFIGTNAAGTTPLGNGGDGIEIGGSPGAPPINNIIGGTEPGARNVISGQGNTGVDLGGSAAGTLIQGNFIGTDVTGTVAISNGVGVNLSANTATVGGTAPAARNVISGNGKGINISTFSGDPHNQILGNYIGVDAAGTTALANGIGIEVNGSNAVIGGTELGSGNVISGNLVGVDCRLGSGTRILGNLIGTDASGNLAVGNQLGVALSSNQNRVGGPEAGARNVISGNLTGVDIGSLTTGGPSGNRIQGNLIGTNAAGTTALGNTLQGVRITQAANNIVGGAGTGEGNTIAFNGWGVSVSQFAATGNRIRGNSVFSNALLGIDLNNDLAVNPNDPLDADAGANMLQNFPVLGAVTASAGTTRVVGTLRSTPGTEFTVDFYANAACDPSGNGEGARPFGSAQVVTDAAGEAAFDVTLPQGLPAGRALTATATDLAGNTSEFSPCAASRASGSVEFSSARYDVLEDVGQAVIRVVRTGGSRGTLTVNYSSGGGTATAGADYTPASGTLTFAEGETEKILNVPIADDGATEPEETVNLTLSGVPELESLGSRPAAVLHIFDSTTPLTIRGGDPAEHGRLLITEGTGGRRNAVVPVSLSAATSRTVTVDYATVGSAGPGGATAGSDFLSVSGTITFEPGSQFKQVVVPVIGDAFDEFEESFSVSFTNPSGASVNNFALVTIVDDDAEPSILVPDVAAAESAAGSKATFSVRLSAVSGKTVSVGYSTADGTASAGSDYTAASSFLTFSPGETVKNVEVTVLADAAAEGDETFTLNLSNPFNATRADSQATATILDSASATPVVRFTNPSYTASESAHTVSIGVTRTGDTSGESTVRYETLGQRASERTDFTRGGGTLRFAPGETAKTFDVLITDDRYSEPVESLNLILSSPTGAALGGPSAVFVTITSDDASDAPSPVRESSFDTQFFVRQHYHDFLNREPDAGGLAFWSNEIEKCGADAQCREVRKINVSAAFFLSIEFQETGYLVYRMYKSAFGDATSPGVAGTVPVVRLEEFLPDTQRIGQGVVVGRPGWPELLEANKQAFALEFVSRQRFLDAYPLTMSPAEFVDRLNEQAGGVLSQEERDALVAELAANNTGAGRASALRRVAEDEDLRRREFNRAFVLMQYYGYLRRNPDDAPDTNFGGWKFWLTKLDEFNGNFIDAQMVKAFIDSIEYTERFGR